MCCVMCEEDGFIIHMRGSLRIHQASIRNGNLCSCQEVTSEVRASSGKTRGGKERPFFNS